MTDPFQHLAKNTGKEAEWVIDAELRLILYNP